MRSAPRGKFLPASSVQGRSAGPEAGRGVPTPPSLPLDSTHPQRAKGYSPLTILKKKSKHKKLALRQSALSL